MKKSYESDLNPEQLKAVSYTKGPSIILAGAGSGKTRVLTYKAMYLLENNIVNPENILMLTFTNKAAAEMKARIRKTIHPEKKPEKIYSSTYHSFCAALLRKYGLENQNRDFAIFDDHDQIDLLKDLLKEQAGKIKVKPGTLAYIISKAKNQLITPAQLKAQATDDYAENAALLYRLYEEKMREINALDFDDLLMKTVQRLTKDQKLLMHLQKQFLHILIDEYQDTNHSQYILAKLLSVTNRFLTVVGDFSQSIYSWRGADYRNLLKFQTDFPEAKVFHLEQNYRSTQPILDLAYKVISQNSTHPILKLWTEKSFGEEVEVVTLPNAQEEAQFVVNKIRELNLQGEYSLQEMAVLYRVNSQSRLFEEICLRFGLPYRIFGGVRFYERKEIKDLLAMLRLLVNPKDEVAVKRIINLGKRRGEAIIKSVEKQKPELAPLTLLQNLLKTAPYLELYDEKDPEDQNRLDNIQELLSVAGNFSSLTEFLDTVALIESGYNLNADETDKLNLMTLHSAKGLEFGAVFIVGLEEGLLPHSRSMNSLEELEEERRLFYVGITRAKQKLFLTYAQKRNTYGRFTYNLPSQFLTALS